MNGNLAVDSCEGGGTTVFVSLPFHIPGEGDSRGDGDRAEMLHDISRDQTILVDEDDRMTQLYLRKTLEKSGVHHSVMICEKLSSLSAFLLTKLTIWASI